MADEDSASRISDPNIAQTQDDPFLHEIESEFRMKVVDWKERISTRLTSLPCGEDGKRSDSLLLEVVDSEIEDLINQCLNNNNLLLLFKGDQNKDSTSVKDASSTSESAIVKVMDTSCQTDGDDDDCGGGGGGDDDCGGRNKDAPALARLSEEFENYKKEVENIIQTKTKAKELELEDKFSLRWKQLVAMETSIHEKLTQSEHHATCLHAALKSAMLELGNLKEKIDEFSASKNSTTANCHPVDLRFTNNFSHINGTSKCQNGSADESPTPHGSKTNPVHPPTNISQSFETASCSTPDNISTTNSISYSKPSGVSNSKVSLFSGAHQFLLNFKYPNDSMVTSYFPSTLFCIPRSSVPPTSSPSSSTTISPTQYVLPNINPFIKLSSSNLPTSPLEVKPKLLAATNISKLLQKSSSPVNVTSSPSVISSHPSIDTFQIPKIEPADVNSPDTSEIAQRVRDILSAHNIGQRQFAREVLGLSQGTVSELLSKPKPWDKLTEKGRESYRKMLAWTQEEHNYQELKATGYKNGQTCIGQQPITIQPITRVDESSSSTEMRISQILMQAQAAIQNQASLSKTPKIDSKLNGDPLKMRPLVQRSAHPTRDLPLVTGRSSVNDLEGVGRRSECQNVNNDSLNFVTRIYREQLLELMKTAEKNKNQAEVERYRAELIRISSQSSTTSNNSNINNSMVDSTGTLRGEVKKEPLDLECCNVASKSLVEGPEDLSFGRNKNSIVKDEPRSPESFNGDLLNENGSNDSTNHNSSVEQNSNEKEASPLRQMQSITNSINSSSNLPPSGSRVILTPIDQDTWEKCSNLNTDDIVQRVKELLSEYCISQRLFGEHVLGLSQGSVSDLLARPKPWYMLTHKGREPFVRMKCFLDEPQSVQNLLSNQYKVPADKLLRVATSLTQSISEPQISSRKRKSSISDECPPNNDVCYKKNNRISFTDDQKKLLRQTYKKDPYPLHSTIEQLASTLEVGVKTVINWFHNHRMRDKSRFSLELNSQSNDSFPQDVKFQVKSEDQSSQSCDSSSDFFFYLNNSGTELGTFATSCENHDEHSKQCGAMDVDDTSEADDMDESGERQKKEMKVSKRKSARPQKMSCHYVADKHIQTSDNPISSSSIEDRKTSEKDDSVEDLMEDEKSIT